MLIKAKRKNLVLLVGAKYTHIPQDDHIEIPDAEGFKLLEKYPQAVEQIIVELAPPPRAKKKQVVETETKDIADGAQQ